MGPLPSQTAIEFVEQLVAHLPKGAIWPREADTVIFQVCAALMIQYTLLQQAEGGLLQDAFPVAPVYLITEWEATLGLPDPCNGLDPTLQQRQQAVAQRFIASGGQSVPYFIALAAALGYTVTISEFSEASPGPFPPAVAPHAWVVNVPGGNYQPLRCGQTLGQRFATWGGTPLECELARLKPAQSLLGFNYTG